MAIHWGAKPPTAVYTYTWEPDLAHGDAIATATVSASGAVIDSYSIDGDVVSFVISGGTAGQTGIITASVTTSFGETLPETIYVPIIGTGSTTATVRDIVAFALRKVTGIAEEPDAEQAADALERLSDMLARWRTIGADVGAPSPLTLNTVVYCPDQYIGAINSNLIIELADLYPFEPTAYVVRNAAKGLIAIKWAQLPETRTGVFY
jgi:hypothetical protein